MGQERVDHEGANAGPEKQGPLSSSRPTFAVSGQSIDCLMLARRPDHISVAGTSVAGTSVAGTSVAGTSVAGMMEH